MNNIIYANKRKKGEEKPITKLYQIIISNNADEPNYFRLDEVPLRYIKNIIVCDPETNEETNNILQEQINGTPTSGKFVVNYDMGLIYCNESDNVSLIKVSYLGTGSVLLASDINELSNIHSDSQKKLTPEGSIIIDEDEYYWSNFAETRYLSIVNTIPLFTSLDIIIEASLLTKDENDSFILCQTSDEKGIGLRYGDGKPSFYGSTVVSGVSNIDIRKKYYYRIISDDGSTFTLYSLKDNNYDIHANLPALSQWTEECTFNENIFANNTFDIGYNSTDPSKYFHGRIFGLIIKCDNNVFFDLDNAQINVDYINHNCSYVSEVENPIITSPIVSGGFNISTIHEEKYVHINFDGLYYTTKLAYSEDTVDSDMAVILSEPISDSTVIFLNGELQILNKDYTYEVLETPNSGRPDIKLTFTRTINGSNIYIIPGLSCLYLGDYTGTTDVYVGRDLKQNTLVFKNGILVYHSSDISQEAGYVIINNDTLRFSTNLNNDRIAVIFNYNNKLSVIINSPITQYDFGTYIPDDTLIFKNGQLLGQYVDWDRVRDNEGQYIEGTAIDFTAVINSNEWLVASIQSAESIYNSIADKQDRLPKLIANKVLSNDGEKLIWVSGGGAGGSNDYTDLYNKPTINSVTLQGNKTSHDLGLQSEIPILYTDANKLLSNNGSAFIWKNIDNTLSESSSNPIQNAAVKNALDTKQATVTGGATTILDNDLSTNKVLISDNSGKVATSTDVTSSEIEYVHGVTSAIQTQLNNKQATISGALEDITNTTLTADKALKSDSNGKVTTSIVTTTELEYLSGVTSGVQNQIDSKQNKIPAGNTNNIVAYSGTAGSVNSLTRVITIDNITNASDTAIPTEKAVRTELNTKQDSLTTQTAYSNKGSATKVPRITTNTLGQVTNIDESNIYNLYDIKLSSQPLTEYGWACLSHTTAKAISKSDVPTVYADIKDKYDNAESAVQWVQGFSKVGVAVEQSVASGCKVGNNFYFYCQNKLIKTTDFVNTTEVADLWQKHLDGNLDFWYFQRIHSIENRYVVLTGTDPGASKNYCYIYDTQTDTFSDLIELYSDYYWLGPKITIVDNKVIFYPEDNSPQKYSYINLSDFGDFANFTSNLITTTGICPVAKVGNIYYGYDSNSYRLVQGTSFNDINTNTIFGGIEISGVRDLVQLDGNNAFFRSNLGTFIINNVNGLVQKDQTSSFGDSKTYTGFDGTNIYFNNGKKYNINTWQDTTITLSGIGAQPAYLYCIGTTPLQIATDNNACFGIFYEQSHKVVKTDTYNINGNNVEIDYYLHTETQTKIVLGTSQNTDLATVFSFQGYLPYFVLDTTENAETTTLPRDKNLWTYMYVDDNYQDSNLPTGNHSPVEIQGNKVTSISASSTDIQYPSAKLVYNQLATKQDSLTTQTVYTTKGTSKKVAQITTNSLGQVTTITEVDIAYPTLTWYDVAQGDFQATDTEIQTNLDNVMKVYKNGTLLREGSSYDYTLSLVNDTIKITFSTALIATDQVAVESL